MDPTNLNQNANQMPTNPATPTPPVAPMNSAMPTGSMPGSASMGQPMNPGVAPTAPMNPAMAAAPAVNPATVASPVAPAGGMPQMPRPVNPVVNPGANMNPNVAMPAIDPSLVVPDASSGAVRANAADVMVGATDPITMPNLPKAPDPVEEELKAPMTAAAPVPGSIGSAISMPAEQAQNPNVAFNDPATLQEPNSQQLNSVAKPAKKKMDKKTLIMLCAVAGIAVVALVIVLIMMLNG